MFFLAAAFAGSLDVVEVGGMWGSPGADNATAAWWNPSRLAGAGSGFLVEGAPTLARVTYDRTAPDYGPAVDHDGDGQPDPYDYGGVDRIRGFGVQPFAGAHTDFGVDGLGVGFAAAVPIGRTGKAVDAPGPGSFHMREGQVAVAHGLLAVGVKLHERVSVGVSGAIIESRWSASVDAETLSVVQQNAGGFVDYGDPQLEDRNYVGTLTYDGLRDTAWTGGAGLTLLPSDRVTIGIGFVAGATLDNRGDIVLETGCPPETDIVGRIAVEGLGLCNTVAPGTGRLAYRIPPRIHAGVVYDDDVVRIEPMAGWVGWSVFDDYVIEARIPASSLPKAIVPEEASRRLRQDRDWARDSRDTFWVGLDGKWQAFDKVELAGRVLYDHPAIPAESLSSNNWDAPMVGLTAGSRIGPYGPLHVGLSVEQFLIGTRTSEDSVFAVTLADDRNPVRTYYPSAAGTYSASITRFGLGLQGTFGAPD